MIKKLLAILLCAATLTACKKGSDTGKNKNDVDPTVAASKLQITDTQGLKDIHTNLVDSRKNSVVTGTKNGYFWLGYFAPDGRQLFVKTFTDDPKTIETANGKRDLNFHFLNYVSEVNGNIYLVHQLRNKDTDLAKPLFFIEDVITLNTATYKVSTQYHIYTAGGDAPYTAELKPWFDTYYQQKLVKTDVNGSANYETIIIRDLNDNPIGQIVKGDDTATDYYALSKEDYVYVNRSAEVVSKNLVTGKLNYKTKLPNTVTNPTGIFAKYVQLNNGVLAVEIVVYYGTSMDTKSESFKFNLSPATGEVIN